MLSNSNNTNSAAVNPKRIRANSNNKGKRKRKRLLVVVASFFVLSVFFTWAYLLTGNHAKAKAANEVNPVAVSNTAATPPAGTVSPSPYYLLALEVSVQASSQISLTELLGYKLQLRPAGVSEVTPTTTTANIRYSAAAPVEVQVATAEAGGTGTNTGNVTNATPNGNRVKLRYLYVLPASVSTSALVPVPGVSAINMGSGNTNEGDGTGAGDVILRDNLGAIVWRDYITWGKLTPGGYSVSFSVTLTDNPVAVSGKRDSTQRGLPSWASELLPKSGQPDLVTLATATTTANEDGSIASNNNKKAGTGTSTTPTTITRRNPLVLLAMGLLFTVPALLILVHLFQTGQAPFGLGGRLPAIGLSAGTGTATKGKRSSTKPTLTLNKPKLTEVASNTDEGVATDGLSETGTGTGKEEETEDLDEPSDADADAGRDESETPQAKGKSNNGFSHGQAQKLPPIPSPPQLPPRLGQSLLKTAQTEKEKEKEKETDPSSEGVDGDEAAADLASDEADDVFDSDGDGDDGDNEAEQETDATASAPPPTPLRPIPQVGRPPVPVAATATRANASAGAAGAAAAEKSQRKGLVSVFLPKKLASAKTAMSQSGALESGAEARVFEMLKAHGAKWLGADSLDINKQFALKSLSRLGGLAVSYSKRESSYMNNGASLDFLLEARRGSFTRLIAVEVDGPWHALAKQQGRDKLKDAVLEKAKVPVIRVPVGDISEASLRQAFTSLVNNNRVNFWP